ncbi:MAG: Formin 2a, partial [Marteilia pararefringens]
MHVPPAPPAFNDNSTSSPAMPPPPGAIVPPGLVGPPGMIKRRTAIPTKPLLKPSNPVRSLMWTRIIQKPDSMKGSFWKQIEQLEDIDYNRLERNFATRSSKPQAPVRKSNINSAQTAAKINLDPKKSRSLEIFFKSQNLSFSQMKYIIDKMLIDESISHIISTLDDNFLSVEEATSIESYMKTNNKTEDDLLRSEANMYRLYLIPGARESIKFLNFINSQQFVVDNSLVALQLLLVFLTDIRDNVTIKKILSIILSYGNFLNGNHPKRCQADGFQLQLLNNLTSFKVSNKKD